MATVFFSDEMQQYTNGRRKIEIKARDYRRALTELSGEFPELTNELYNRFSVAIDGAIIHTPLLETFQADSELVFIPKLSGG
jgi:hypothetical protein